MGTVEDVIADALTKISVWTEHDLRVTAIATALREAGMVREWEPIETAPKDGLWVFVYWPTMPISLYPMVAYHQGDEYGWDTPFDYGQISPTHWRPLPAPPLPEGTEK